MNTPFGVCCVEPTHGGDFFEAGLCVGVDADFELIVQWRLSLMYRSYTHLPCSEVTAMGYLLGQSSPFSATTVLGKLKLWQKLLSLTT